MTTCGKSCLTALNIITILLVVTIGIVVVLVDLPVIKTQQVGIHTENAPGAIAPYSQAIKSDGLVFVAGQIGMTPAGVFEAETAGDQTFQALTNIQNILEEAGVGMKDVVKVTVMMTDIEEYDEINEVYGEFFEDPKPARSAFQVGALPKTEAKVEIEVIATYK